MCNKSCFLIAILLSFSCNHIGGEKEVMLEGDPSPIDEQAVIVDVSSLGTDGNYTFNVSIRSPETGCDKYADWWEVILPDSTLIYRRVLAHSHVSEQPFTRSGGPVMIGENDFVYIRAHMNTSGYGSTIFAGTVKNGLAATTLRSNYASSLAEKAPLPSSCAF